MNGVWVAELMAKVAIHGSQDRALGRLVRRCADKQGFEVLYPRRFEPFERNDVVDVTERILVSPLNRDGYDDWEFTKHGTFRFGRWNVGRCNGGCGPEDGFGICELSRLIPQNSPQALSNAKVL